MQGVPRLSDEELLQASQSAEIHARSRRVIRCIREAAGEAGLEQPPSSMAWLEEDNITLLRELCAHCAHVAACEHGMDYYKSWAFCASFASIRTLASTCCHAPGAHKSIAGLKQGNIHVSALTAEYPGSLATALAALLQPFCTQTGICKASISDFANLLCEPIVHRRPPVCNAPASIAQQITPIQKPAAPFETLFNTGSSTPLNMTSPRTLCIIWCKASTRTRSRTNSSWTWQISHIDACARLARKQTAFS